MPRTDLLPNEIENAIKGVEVELFGEFFRPRRSNDNECY